MCGIVGYINKRATSDAYVARLKKGLDLLQHRGPDDEGSWRSEDGRVALGNRRLAIIDLRGCAGQPMVSDDGRYVLVFNGEIYNFKELRGDRAFAQTKWKTQGDTEVLLHALALWGNEAFERLDGMYAVAFYDAREKSLLLARDRFGEKPLYLAKANGAGWCFSSTLPSILSLLDSDPAIDTQALNLYWSQFEIGNPRTIYRDIESIVPGAWVKLAHDGRKDGVYWTPDYDRPSRLDFATAVERSESAIRQSLKRRLVSDVPLGCYLSGGVDSSLVTAMIAGESQNRLDTFTIGFGLKNDPDYKFSAQVSKIYETNHHSVNLDSSALEILPSILWHYGQPFSDCSCIPSFYVAKLARQSVVVVMTGEGGDEIFGGYDTTVGVDLASLLRKHLPRSLLAAAGKISAPGFNLPRGSLLRAVSTLMAMANCEPGDAYDIVHEKVILSKPAVNRPEDVPDWRHAHFDKAPHWPAFQRALYCDIRGRLADKFLIKTDVASMANSVETRTPFLSRDVFDTVKDLRTSVIFRGFRPKAILKKIGEKYLPKSLLYRWKQGFSPPLAAWLRHERYGATLEWAFGNSCPAADWVDVTRVRRMWLEQYQGLRNYDMELFGVLSFNLWWLMFVERRLDPATPLSAVAQVVTKR
jgi:asparagine synthase (glutamine-hydrolysing)